MQSNIKDETNRTRNNNNKTVSFYMNIFQLRRGDINVCLGYDTKAPKDSEQKILLKIRKISKK